VTENKETGILGIEGFFPSPIPQTQALFKGGVVMFTRILVPLDGSHLAERALPPALVLAGRAGVAAQLPGEIILLRVPVAERMLVHYPARHTFLMPEQSFEYSRLECTQYLDTIRETYQRPDVVIRQASTEQMTFLDTDVAAALIDTAALENVDLIVMSPHGRSGFTRWMLGSVTERVLRHVNRPVWMVRSDKPVQRLLLPLDGSELAETAVPAAVELAQMLDCCTLLLRVEPPMVVDAYTIGQRKHVEVAPGNQLQCRFHQDAARYLEGQAERFRSCGLKVESVVAQGKPANTILEMAEIHHSDLIVMATHGRSGLKRWVYGSVTEKVLRSALCSLMIVRSQP
jgi:nucleotide-binding universal stress UspA family protein